MSNPPPTKMMSKIPTDAKTNSVTEYIIDNNSNSSSNTLIYLKILKLTNKV